MGAILLSFDEIIQLRESDLRTFYRNLSLEEGQWLAKQTVERFSENSELAEKIFSELASHVPGSLQPIIPFILKQEIIFYPRHLFKDADASVRDQLIAEVESNPNRNLYMLAWIGDERVQEFFAYLRKNPPEWENFNSPPEDYSYEAGWELDKADKRRDLFYHTAYHLVHDAGVNASLVCPFERLDERCSQCGNRLAILFDFDLTLPELSFLNLNGTRLRIKTCLACSCYGEMMVDVDLHGHSEMRKDNEPNQWGIKVEVDDDYDWSEDRVYLGEQQRTPYESLVYGEGEVGGYPDWLTRVYYPECRVCKKAMPFIAQVQVSSLGLYYAHLCEQCGVAAVHYQNT